MQTQQFAANEIIFRAGDPSVAVYIITEGEVSISLNDGLEVIRLHAGDLFGESGVLEKRPRSATATARAATTLLINEAETFLHAFGMDNDRALALVKLLCRRLRSTSVRAAHADLPHGPIAAGTEHAAILLLPEHERLTAEYGMTAINVAHLPFQVGNRFGGEYLPIASNRSCCIPARGDLELAAPHFEITRRSGQLGIHDLGSRWGTIVNGVTINRISAAPFEPLRSGGNHVIAGRANSPYRFRIQVQEA